MERRTAELESSNRRLQHEITELRLAQRQIVHQARLNALAQMASGVAHEFNNSLSPIVGFAELMISKPELLDDRDTALKWLQDIATAARDAAKVVTQLRDFYHGEDLDEFQAIDINALAEQAVGQVSDYLMEKANASGTTIEVETDFGAIDHVAGVASSLLEAIANLIVNGADAMPEGGRITISTWQADDTISLEVKDTGYGMTHQVLSHCLDPFFSTKGERGTGLGLAIVQKEVERHMGRLLVDSVPGEGSTFTIGLPSMDSFGGQRDLVATDAADNKPPARLPV